MRHPSARGLLVATGAVDRAALALLDGMAAVEALPGEGPGWEAALRSAATTAFEANPVPVTADDERAAVQEEEAREALRRTRMTHEAASTATRSRLEKIDFGPDERGSATAALARGSAPIAPASAYGADALALDSFLESVRAQTPTVLSFLTAPANFPFLPILVLSIGLFVSIITAGEFVGRLVDSVFMFSRPESAYGIVGFLLLQAVVVSLLLGFFLAHRYQAERRAFTRYQRWGSQKLEEMLVGGVASDELLRVKNRLIDAPDASGGFRRAFEYANEALPPWLRDDLHDRFSSMSAKQ
jgi:hypothetical protein